MRFLVDDFPNASIPTRTRELALGTHHDPTTAADSRSMNPDLLRFLAELGARPPVAAPRSTPSSLAKTTRLPRLR